MLGLSVARIGGGELTSDVEAFLIGGERAAAVSGPKLHVADVGEARQSWTPIPRLRGSLFHAESHATGPGSGIGRAP